MLHFVYELKSACLKPLEKAFLDATFAPNRHLDPIIKKINLGIFAKEADLLRRITANDPKGKEASKLILILNDITKPGAKNEVVIEREPRLGEVLKTASPKLNILAVEDVQERRSLLKKQRQDKFIATSLHSHDAESPPSPTDITNILKDDIEDPSAYTSVFVTSPSLNYLVFRSTQTPQLNKSDIIKLKEALKKSWKGKIEEAYKSEGIFRSDEEWFVIEAVFRQQFLSGLSMIMDFLPLPDRLIAR